MPNAVRFFQVVALVVIVSALVIPGTTKGDRKLVSQGSSFASVPSDFECGKRVSITVDAPNVEYFEGSRVPLQKLIGGIRASLGFECPSTDLKHLHIEGHADGRLVFKARSKKDNDWHLEDIKTLNDSATRQSQSAAYESSHSVFEQDGFVVSVDKKPVCDNRNFAIISNDAPAVVGRKLTDEFHRFMTQFRQHIVQRCAERDGSHNEVTIVLWQDGYPVFRQSDYRLWAQKLENHDDLSEPQPEKIFSLDDALLYATVNRYTSVVETLIDKGASVSAQAWQEKPQYSHPICSVGYAPDIFRLFIGAGLRAPFGCAGAPDLPSFDVVKHGTLDDLERLLDAGAKLNRRYYSQSYPQTPVGFAAEHHDDPRFIKRLIEAGAAPTEYAVNKVKQRFDDKELLAFVEQAAERRASELKAECERLAAPPKAGGENGYHLNEINPEKAIDACRKAAIVDHSNVLGSDVEKRISYSEFYGDRARYITIDGDPTSRDVSLIGGCRTDGTADSLGDHLTDRTSPDAAFFYARMWYEVGPWLALMKPSLCYEWAADTIRQLASNTDFKMVKNRAREYIRQRTPTIPDGWKRLSSDDGPFCEYLSSRTIEEVYFGGCSAAPGGRGQLVCYMPDNHDADTLRQPHYTGRCRVQDLFGRMTRTIIPSDQ